MTREAWAPAEAARWLAEALVTGSPLRDLPAEIAPRDVAEGQQVAAAVLDELDLAACGVRLLRLDGGASIAGPMIEGRLLSAGGTLARDSLREPSCTAAVIGVLAAALEEGAAEPPRFSALHAAIDVAATRFTTSPADPALIAADLGRLGHVVAGKARKVLPPPGRVAIGAKGARVKGVTIDLEAAFAEAAAAARGFGGLPAGALLVVAGLGPATAAEGVVAASVAGLGRVEITLA